jgi:hypothetical protein
LCQGVKRYFFEKVLSDEPVGMLVEVPLSGMIGMLKKISRERAVKS